MDLIKDAVRRWPMHRSSSPTLSLGAASVLARTRFSPQKNKSSKQTIEIICVRDVGEWNARSAAMRRVLRIFCHLSLASMRFHSPLRVIILAWVNDREGHSAHGRATHAYRVFAGRLDKRNPRD